MLEIRHAQCEHVKLLNRYLLGLYVRTRRTLPTEIILDINPTDDPVHAGRTLTKI